MTDACTKTYLKAASEAQTATKQALRDWKQNLDRKASAELSSRGTAALQDAMEAQVRLELERLKECLAKIRLLSPAGRMPRSAPPCRCPRDARPARPAWSCPRLSA